MGFIVYPSDYCITYLQVENTSKLLIIMSESSALKTDGSIKMRVNDGGKVKLMKIKNENC